MNTTESPPAHIAEPAEAPSAPLSDSSILDTVRAIRERQASADPRRLELPVPGYQGKLAVIYRFPPEGVERVLKSIEDMVEADSGLAKAEAAADRLIACCAAIVGHDENAKPVDLLTGEPIPEGGFPEAPLRFDLRFADLIGLEVPAEVKAKARFIVRHVFSPMALQTGRYEGDLALISTSNVLFGWLTGAETEIEETALGE